MVDLFGNIKKSVPPKKAEEVKKKEEEEEFPDFEELDEKPKKEEEEIIEEEEEVITKKDVEEIKELLKVIATGLFRQNEKGEMIPYNEFNYRYLGGIYAATKKKE